MPWVGFEPTISAGERPKTYALDRTATGTGNRVGIVGYNYYIFHFTRSVNSKLQILGCATVAFSERHVCSYKRVASYIFLNNVLQEREQPFRLLFVVYGCYLFLALGVSLRIIC